jgi:hypothetical protein
MEDEEKVFPGFWHPDIYDVGYTRLPHDLIERMHKMSDCELRVVLYIFRHTWGFQEIDNEVSKNRLGRGKKLTTDEFVNGRKSAGTRMDGGTGLSDRGVKNGIAQALEHGYIVCEVDDSDKARVRKYYSIKLR